MKERIAMFGTSADPPTIGHRDIIQWLAGKFDRVLVWAVDNPFKRQQTPLAYRQQMLEMLISSYQPPLSNVFWMPELSDRRSLTSVLAVESRWPDAHLTLVVGADVLQSLADWYRVQDLMRRVDFLMLQRPDFDVHDSQLNSLRQLGAKIQVANFRGPRVSSSDFRVSHNRDMIPVKVWNYLQKHQLYQGHHV